MPNQDDDNVQHVVQRDTKRYEVQDNDGHLKGSHQAESSTENMEKLRKEDENDQSELNQTDARGTVSGNEAI